MKHILDKSIEAAPSHEKGLEEKRMEQLSVNEQVTKAYLTKHLGAFLGSQESHCPQSPG